MKELAIPFIVVIGPTIFVLVLEFVTETIRKSIWWRIGVFIFGTGLSVLTFWQLTSDKRTAANEREKAVKQTAKEVATETSKEVTKALTEQYSQMVADQKTQITDLQSRLAAQADDLRIIKGSNIVTGKKPVPVTITNPGAPPPSVEALPNISCTQAVRGDSANGHKVQAVMFKLDGVLNYGAFVAVCDRACKAIRGSLPGMHKVEYLTTQESNVAGMIFRLPRPMPSEVLCEMELESADDKPINILSFRILRESEIPIGIR